MATELLVGVDVGTLSVRAGLFEPDGRCLASAVHPITLHRPRPAFAEQSSAEIWEATGRVVRQALSEAGAAPERVAGIGFDATCSLVLLDAAGAPLSVDPGGAPERNVIVWMDHRATEQAERLSASGAEALRYVGGRLSPEMEVPKLTWLREEMPDTFDRIGKALDLADFLVLCSSGSDPRSVCTVACKWGYLAHEDRFDRALYRAGGVEAVLEGGRAGTAVAALGSSAGRVTAEAARHLGVGDRARVATGIIDAHAGGIGALGTAEPAESHLAMIAGTSACHMAVSRQPCFVPGVWGPYLGAMIPGLWLSEGGQSAAGALLEHLVGTHARAAELGEDPWARLDEIASRLEAAEGPGVTRGLHVLPDFHGNRSPRADPHARGAIAGLGLDGSVEALARLWLAALQALAYGTRHIIETMNAHGHTIRAVRMCGGGAKSARWVAEHADVLGMDVGVVREPDAMLLGSAMLASVAAGIHPSVAHAMRAMGARVDPVRPRADRAELHARRYQVFLQMVEDQRRTRQIEEAP